MSVLEEKPHPSIKQRFLNAWLRLQREWRLRLINDQVKRHANIDAERKPVVFFNTSSRIGGFSQNAAFSLITSWGVQLTNNPVVHFVCKSGMTRCVLGTNLDDPYDTIPCERCIKQSKRLLASAEVYWFEYHSDPELDLALKKLSLNELINFQLVIDDPHLFINGQTLQVGQLVLPALRWVLRRHDLLDDDSTRFLFRSFIQSANSLLKEFDSFLDSIDPTAVVIFNGIMYPEAAARWVAKQRGIRVITQEVGFQPFSAFFTEGQATAYPLHIPETFQLSPEQNERLDRVLSLRFKGDFTMAGIRFWPKMQGLKDEFLARAVNYKQIVPIFTNVINDTSQVHASTVFSHMYDWLDHVMEVVLIHPETLFVIRAHPDEKRRGTRKHSRQAVSDWIESNQHHLLPNVVFVDSNEPLSSYELIRISKFIMVYNSSIGLEAALLGVPVLCGGKARYTQYPTVFFPQTPKEYQDLVNQFLAQEVIEIPELFAQNARRVIYWQLFRTSLPFGRFINAHPTPGYVQLRKFPWRDLMVGRSATIKVLVKGILTGEPFIMPDSVESEN